MEDILLAHIRYMKKEIEREIKIVFLQLKKYLSDSQTKAEFKEKTSELSEKIKYMKNKLAQLKQEEKKMIEELKNRLTKTFDCLSPKDSTNCTYEKIKEFNEYQNNILLGEYFLNKGLLETFFSFEKENKITIYEYNIYSEQKLLMNYINEEKTKKILEWVKFYKKKIIANNNSPVIISLLSDLFYIYKNEHACEPNYEVNCITFIRKYFNDFTISNKEDITKLIMSLIVPKPKKNDDSKENDTSTENKGRIKHIKDIVNEKYKEIFNLGSLSLFELLLTFGITTLKTSVCEKNNNIIIVNKNLDCPICGDNAYNITKSANKIFNYVHNRSHLFCSITGKVTNASNPPMINKEGKIICKACINKYKISEEKYLDPKTKKEYDISECKLLYLS